MMKIDPRSTSTLRTSTGTLCGLVVLALWLLAPLPAVPGGTPATSSLSDQLITPAGSWARARAGDYISSNRPAFLGLNQPYRFYVEVPSGLSTLQVDIFDPDVWSQGVAEQNQDRDRLRTGPTFTRYTLFDPAGNRVPIRYGFGDNGSPSTGDNAWLSFYNSATAVTTGGTTFLDTFATQVYNRNDGTGIWSTNWTETNDNGNAATGKISVTAGGQLTLSNAGGGALPSISRGANLSGFAAAVLSFDFQTGSANRIQDALRVEVSANGGTTWESIDTFRGNEFVNTISGTSGSRAYDITPFISATTRIRFRVHNAYNNGGNPANTYFRADNVQIRATVTASGAAPAAGHWLLQADLTDGINHFGTGGNPQTPDDNNAFGIRAHDGDTSAGGTELNVYAESFTMVGVNDTDHIRDYNLYPYVTSGCTVQVNDYDWDSDQGSNPNDPSITPPFGRIRLTTRSGTLLYTSATMSINEVWDNNVTSSFASPTQASDYGIWLMEVRIADWDQGNYGLIYLGNSQAANPNTNSPAGPTSQPEANSLRIYFPTDASTAPAKPYVTHYLTHTGEGPNPPQVGQTSRYAITVQVVNPAGALGPITFSTPTNLVTARFLGGVMTYRGVGLITAGSVVSQPTNGSTTAGDVTWNPGTVAAGSTVLLSYLIDVTPVGGGDIVATGTVGSGNGTRARYVDETGDTVNSRATQSLGELCPLTIPAATPTPVLVSELRADAIDGEVVVQWQTAAEAETVELDLYRQQGEDLVKVNARPLTALLDSPQGGTYRFVDPSAATGDRLTYFLVETESSGETRFHGPFTVAVGRGLGVPAEVPADGYERTPHPPRQRTAASVDVDDLHAADGSVAKAAVDDPHPVNPDNVPALKLAVTEPGLYRVTAEELAPHFGFLPRQVRNLISRHGLRLTRHGQPVAWQDPNGDGEALDFYAAGIHTLYTDRDVFRLSVGQGTPIEVVAGEQPPASWEEETFRDTVRFEENLRQLVLAPIDPEGDIWFWNFVKAGDAQNASKSFALEPPGVAPTVTTAELTVSLQGASRGLHAVEVKLNGQTVGQVQVQDFGRVSTTLDVGQEQLTGADVVELTATSGLAFVDAFDLTYDRLYTAAADRLLARGDGNERVAPAGFTDPQIRVFDLNAPLRPRLLAGVRIVDGDAPGQYRAIFEPAAPITDYFAVSEAGVRPVAGITVDRPSALLSTARAADYLILTTRELEAAAQELADHRADSGLRTMVVDLEDVYDELNHGVADPRKVRELLAWAAESWTVAPRYVVLAGAGTYDYHDYLGFGGNLIPTLLVDGGGSLVATDVPYADFAGDDGVPDVMLGRIPALTAGELAAYVDKVVAYESLLEPDWASDVLLLADNPDAVADFGQANERVGTLLPAGYTTTVIDLGDVPLATARQQLMSALAAGAGAVTYFGHGGVDRLASEGLLTSADVPGLTNTDRPTVLTAITCHINLHGLPGFDSLGEQLVLAGGGAVAVFAPAWLSQHSEASLLGDRLYHELFYPAGDGTLGEAVQRALGDAAVSGVPPSLLQTYQLLGDPALATQLRPVPIENEPCQEDCDTNDG